MSEPIGDDLNAIQDSSDSTSNINNHDQSDGTTTNDTIDSSSQPLSNGADNSNQTESKDLPYDLRGLEMPPIRQYLDKEVVPTLLSGLSELVKQRPENPLLFLADYLEKKANGETN